MFVADLPPEVPPAFIQSVCGEDSASKKFDSYDGMTLNQLIKRATLSSKVAGKIQDSMKFEMIKRSAFSYGTQGGFYARASQIKKMLKAHEEELDRVFNFNALTLNAGRVIPPVISQSFDSISQTDSRSLRITDASYVIDTPARFSSTAPNWRSYLFLITPDKPKVPDVNLLPVTSFEKSEWSQAVKRGWAAGKCQADKSYASALADLRHDFIGMVRYHILLRKNMVSEPFVTATNEKITREDNKLVIGDQILRITAMPGFKISEGEWDGLVEADPFYKKARTFELVPKQPSIRESRKSLAEKQSFRDNATSTKKAPATGSRNW